MPAGSFSATFGRTLRWRLNRLRCMSPAELPYRAARLIAAHVESIAPRRRSIPPMDRGPWSRRWVHVPEGLDPAPYVAEADRIASGALTVFALSCADGGLPPRWNRDPKTGVEAPPTAGKLLDYRDRRLGGEHKYLGEPNRHPPPVTLRPGYRLARAQGAGLASGGAADSRARGAAAELDRRRQSRAGGVLPAVRARFPAARAARGPERRRTILRGLRAAPGRDARLPRFDHGCGRQRADDRRRRRRRGNPTGAEPRLLDLSVAPRERGDSVRQRRAQGESREAGRQDALAVRIAGRGAVPPGRGAARAGAAAPGFPGRRLLHPRLRLRDPPRDPSGRGRRSPRLSQHRRPRTCRCARFHAVARRARVPDRSRDLRVSRWRGVARVLPRHRRAQHAAHRRRGSVAPRGRIH